MTVLIIYIPCWPRPILAHEFMHTHIYMHAYSSWPACLLAPQIVINEHSFSWLVLCPDSQLTPFALITNRSIYLWWLITLWTLSISLFSFRPLLLESVGSHVYMWRSVCCGECSQFLAPLLSTASQWEVWSAPSSHTQDDYCKHYLKLSARRYKLSKW